MERAIQIYAIINFAVIGISHTFQPRVWVPAARLNFWPAGARS